MAANRIAKMLGKKHLIATTRIRTGLKGNLLHPIATWPSQLSSFILDGGNHSEFSFDTNALNGGGGEELVNAPADWRGMEYDLSTPDDRKTPFTRHIDASLSFARESPEDYGLDAAELEELQQRGTCLVIGGFKGTSKNNATDVKLDRLCGSRGS